MKAVSIPADITITAKWDKVNDVTVTVDFNDGETANAEITVAYSEKIAELADPTRDGYLFRGWKTNLDAYDGVYTTEEIKEISVTAAMTITAQWISADTRYTVTVSYNDGVTADTTEDVQIGQHLSLTDPVVAGKIFKGWRTDLADYTGIYTTEEINAIAVESAFTVTAQWAQTYTVTFVNASENDAEIATVIVEEGGNAVLPVDADYYFMLEDNTALFNITANKTIRLTPVHKSLYNTVDNGLNGSTKADLESSMGLTLIDSANGKKVATPAYGFVTYVKGQAICFSGNFAGAVKFYFNTDKPIKATFALEIDGVIVSEFSFEKPEDGNFGKEVVMYEQLSAGEHTIRLILTDISGESGSYGFWGAANITKISIGIAQPQGTETGTEA